MELDKLSRLLCCRIEEVRSRHACISATDEFLLPGVRIHIREVVPVAQNGPQCGLVALQMASSVLSNQSLPIERIFSTAQQLGFTKQGEMFSADWLCSLSTELWPSLSARVSPFPTVSRLCQSILDGVAVLIPYDCDRNHEPAMKDGHTAHWSIIVGFLYINRDDTSIEVTSELPPVLNEDTVYLFAYHGKSKHMGLWKYRSLRDSNQQLLEVGGARDSEEYVIPAGGMEELRGKCVLIAK